MDGIDGTVVGGQRGYVYLVEIPDDGTEGPLFEAMDDWTCFRTLQPRRHS